MPLEPDIPPCRPIPHLEFFLERFVDEQGSRAVELWLPVIALEFDYAGTRLRVSDPRNHFFIGGMGSLREVACDTELVRSVQLVLENHGALELEQVTGLLAPYDTRADYLLRAEHDPQAFYHFFSAVVPRLQAAGCRIDCAEDYPYRVLAENPPLRPWVKPDFCRRDWFSLALGLEVSGAEVDILPLLVELVDSGAADRVLRDGLRAPLWCTAVPLGQKGAIMLRPERLRLLFSVLLELCFGIRQPRTSSSFPPWAGGAVLRLLRAEATVPAELLFAAAPAALALSRLLEKSGSVPPAEAFRELPVNLRDYQRQGVVWLRTLWGSGLSGLLADDMGLGKTLQLLAALALERKEGGLEAPVLIVVPRSLLENWRRELERMIPEAQVCVHHGPNRALAANQLTSKEFVITSYAVLVRDLELLSALFYHAIVLDEAQLIKNPRSRVARATKSLRCARRVALTGTPIENRLSELWSIFDFLMPELLGSLRGFRRVFSQPIEARTDLFRAEALSAKLRPFLLRRTKEEVARELPAKTQLVRSVELTGEQRELYENVRVSAHTAVRRAIALRGLGQSQVTVLDALLMLRQICCDPRLVRLPSARRVTRSAKRELFFELLTQELSAGRRVLVVSQFARMLALLTEEALSLGLRCLLLTGRTVDRQGRVDAFQNGEADVFFISLKAGGIGLNLTRADTVIHYDPWWNATAQAQATDRAHRIGQEHPVFVWDLVVTGSVEERILSLQHRKSELAQAVLAGAPASWLVDPAQIEHLLAPLDD